MFDVRKLKPAILHLGCGAFSRAHQAVFTQRAVEIAGEASYGWGIRGVSFRRTTVRDMLAPQDCLYTVLERGPDFVKAEVIGVLRDVLFARENRAELVDAFRQADTRIVTLTITPSGYCQGEPLETGSGAGPRSGSDVIDRASDAISVVVAGLAAVRAQGSRPPVLMSCDNIPRNGVHLREAVIGRASLVSGSLARWISGNVQFPCSVVDRIVPSPTIADSADAARLLGLQDLATVSTEPFRQWVIEDFEGARPRWELAGAQFVNDTSAWEASKLNLLNGTHMAIAYLGMLAGLETVAQFVSDPLFARYTSRLMLQEQVPTIPRSDHDLVSYSKQLLGRWRNRGIVHQLERIGRHGSEKLQPRLLRSLASNMAAGREAPCSVLAVAAWICCAGRLIPFDANPQDRLENKLRQLAADANGSSSRLVDLLLEELHGTFGGELAAVPEFRSQLGTAIDALKLRGTRGAISMLLGRGS
jgi:fructuronate reductase